MGTAKLKISSKLLLPLAISLTPIAANAIDDGSQLNERFRINYAGYLPEADKIAFYLTPNRGDINWQIEGSECAGRSERYISNDSSSGDSFYVIDFSQCVHIGQNLRVKVDNDRSLPFAIIDDPYGNLKYEFFDYFRDHETQATFANTKNDWSPGLSLSFSYVKDAGDNGAYPTNTAEASWALINLLETYPAVNGYYSDNFNGARTIYSQLNILTEQFLHVQNHNGSLAIAKFHTNANTWADCSPFANGTCISEPETKATFATARTLAAMARVHSVYGTAAEADDSYNRAQKAWDSARNTTPKCNQAEAFGGEGGYYPDNDNYSLWRDPKTNRDNCVADRNNTEDDEYAAVAELFLAAQKLNKTADAGNYRSVLTGHPRFAEMSSFWWGAVAAEGNLSLLTNKDLHNLNLNDLKNNLAQKAESILTNQNRGYPGVTWDANSNQWDNGDQNNADNNVRWGSHRMALNDARLLMAAAEVARTQSDGKAAAKYTRGALKVMDHISGINAMNLAMYTAKGYSYIENAVERTHDGADNADNWPGKMVLGPNNWTNAGDKAMPEFGSLPGLKMFAVEGTGWASREISIDANAALVPVAYFTTEVAPSLMLLDPYSYIPPPVIPEMTWPEPEPPVGNEPEPQLEPKRSAPISLGYVEWLTLIGLSCLRLLIIRRRIPLRQSFEQ